MSYTSTADWETAEGFRAELRLATTWDEALFFPKQILLAGLRELPLQDHRCSRSLENAEEGFLLPLLSRQFESSPG